MQTIQQPYEVTVSPYDLAIPPRASHLVVSMLEEKQSLLFRYSVDGDELLCSS